jgi:ATP-dependent DNA helicase RecG
VLIYAGPLGEIARQRLKIIFENTDGFEIARQDLQIRGPGEFVGAAERRAAAALCRPGMDADLVDMARVAEEMLLEHPALAEKHLQRWLGSRENCSSPDPRSGGARALGRGEDALAEGFQGGHGRAFAQ